MLASVAKQDIAPPRCLSEAVERIRAALPPSGASLPTAVGIYQLWADSLPPYGTMLTWAEMADIASVSRTTARKYGLLLRDAGLMVYQQMRQGKTQMPNFFQVARIMTHPPVKRTQAVQYPHRGQSPDAPPATSENPTSDQQTDAFVVVGVEHTNIETDDIDNSDAATRLTRHGVSRRVANALAASHPHDLIAAWCNDIEANPANYQSVGNVAGLLVASIKAGQPPAAPEHKTRVADGRRYATGRYAEYINH